MNVSGMGGVFGDTTEYGGSVGNVDFYASGDTRIPKILGIGSRRGGFNYISRLNKTKRKRKKNRSKKMKTFYEFFEYNT